MSWLDKIIKIRPPRSLDDEEAVYNWMFSIFTTLSLVGVVTGVHVMLTWGMVPLIFTGFATAADVSEISKGQEMIRQSLEDARKETQLGTNDIKATIIGQNIYNLRIMQCNLLKSRNGPAVEALEAQITAKKNEFFAVAGYQYQTSSCENLGITP